MKTRARVSVPPNGTIAGSLKVTGSDCFQEKPGTGFTITGADSSRRSAAACAGDAVRGAYSRRD